MDRQFNEWTFSGEVFYIKELTGEFTGSIKVRGLSQREGAFSTKIVELPCLMQDRLWKQFKEKQIKVYDKITISGHLETWSKNSHGKPVNKTMFIIDYIIDVEYNV